MWPITTHPLVIGRRADCDIVVTDSYVSRHQCEIWLSERGVQLRNLSRTNPTVINNGLMLEPVLDLQVGDRVSVGPCKFLLTTEESLPMERQKLAPSRRPRTNETKDGTTLFIQQLS